MYLTDPKTKEKSVTLTLLITGFVVCLLKLLTSGVSFGNMNLGAFSGSDFAIAVGSLGAIYWGRKQTDSKIIIKENINE